MVPNKELIAKYEREKAQIPTIKKSSNKPLQETEEEKDKVENLPPPTRHLGMVGGRRKSTLMKGFVNTLGNNMIKDLLDEPIFDQVGRMGQGKSFGELALLKTKPRAARIVCETNCEFACMCKADYKNVLAKIEERLANDMIDFLQSIPLFSTWSRNLLMKLLYKIEKRSLIKNQVMIKEGDPVNEIFIIKSGEFEVSSKVQEKKEFHLELTEKLQGKNYLQKFLKPK